MFYNRPISLYNSVRDNTGRAGKMEDFLSLCYRNRNAIADYRKTTDQEVRQRLKRSLPCATISGRFAPTRAKRNLIEHSGLICIDIDHCDCASTLNTLYKLDYVAFASPSVSGNGVFAIIPLAYPDKHQRQFDALKEEFTKLNIEIDQQCGDVTRLRVISYDPDAVVKLNVEPYAGLAEERRPAVPAVQFNAFDSDSVLKNVSAYVHTIVQNHIDITDGYENWFRCGCALARLGEDGRDYFHAVSAVSPQYNQRRCDRMFDDLLRGSGITIATFFDICHKHGIILSLK